MGNFTEIEQSFNKALEIQIPNLTKSLPPNSPQFNNALNKLIGDELAKIRFGYMRDISEITGRNTICYISAWLQGVNGNIEYSINDNDMIGLMNAVSGLDKSKGLDIVLHTPGGNLTATESIVKYLRLIFKNNIRVIVPHMAMSAGTMIACSSKEIIMGKQSSLGPIDPQYHNVPAQGVIKEFERAIKETRTNPNSSLIWKEIIQQYRPTFLGECENAVELSSSLVEDWLKTCMFKNSKAKNDRVNKILDELGRHDQSKVHDRHYGINDCKKIGLKIVALESNQTLQDKVLSLYHSYVLTIYKLPNTIKFIESQNGQTLIISGKR